MTPLDQLVKTYKVKLGPQSPIAINEIGRPEFIEIMRKAGYLKGAELGVFQGEFAEALVSGIPGLEYYGIDSWLAYGDYIDYRRKSYETLEVEQDIVWDNAFKIAKERLSKYSGAKLLRGYSTELVGEFEDESLDFVYIDANHDLRHTIEDLDDWSRKVRPGGIIAGHDYWRKSISNATIEALNVWTKVYKIAPWFVFYKDYIESTSGPSWFWVKE